MPGPWGRSGGCPPPQRAHRASPRSSSGPQSCAACVHEGIYEEGVSILESSSVSEPSVLRRLRHEMGPGGSRCTGEAAFPKPRPGPGAGGGGLTRGPLSPQAFPDNAARREVESLPAVCPSEGCSWKGTLKDYEVGASTGESSCRWGGRMEPRAWGWGARHLCPLLGWPRFGEQQRVRGPGPAQAPREQEVSFLTAGVVLSSR